MGAKELEQAIRLDPSNLNNYLVYGDVLQEQGEPRGELMALQHAQLLAPDDKRLRGAETALIAKHQQALLGPLADNLDSLHLDWHMGFIRSARLFGGQSLRTERRLESLLRNLLEHPSSIFMQDISLGTFVWGRQTESSAAKFVQRFGRRLSRLRRVFLFDDLRARKANVSSLFRSDSELRALSLNGALRLGESMQVPLLKELHIHHKRLDDMQASAEALRLSSLPSLDSITLWCPNDLDYQVLLHALADKKLRFLRVWHLENATRFVNELLETPMAQELETLDLSGCGLDRAAARSLMKHKPRLAKLQHLWLDGNHLEAEDCTKLARTFGQVRAEAQLPRDEELPYWSDGTMPSLLACKAHAMLPGSAHATDAFSVLRESAGGGRMLYNRASLMMMEGQYGASLPLAKASLALPDPAFIKQAYENVAIVHANQGDYETAIEIARRSLLVHAPAANPYAILIDALRQLRRMDEALGEVEEGQGYIDQSPEGMALLQDCMLTHLVDGNPSAARELYEHFVDTHGMPRPTVVACAAIAHSHLRDAASARECLHHAKDANCRDPIAEHATACLFALEGKPKSARLALERAREAEYPEMHFCLNEDPLLSEL